MDIGARAMSLADRPRRGHSAVPSTAVSGSQAESRRLRGNWLASAFRLEAGTRRGAGDLQLFLVHVDADIGKQRRAQIALAGVGQHAQDRGSPGRVLADFERARKCRAGADANENSLLLRELLAPAHR